MHILPQIGKNHSQARILTDGNVFLGGNGRIFQQLPQNVAPHWRRLPVQGRFKAPPHTAGQFAAGPHSQSRDGVGDAPRVNILHVSSRLL